MSSEAIVVFTFQSTETIVAMGGTSAWHLAPKNARLCEFAVCTRNAKDDRVEGPEAHHSAFLVGRVRGVVPCPGTPGTNGTSKTRFLIQFSEFARVNAPNAWKNGQQNPICYKSLQELGIDPLILKWEPMPSRTGESKLANAAAPIQQLNPLPLTLAEAKKGLALTFNVPPESIEITIRG